MWYIPVFVCCHLSALGRKEIDRKEIESSSTHSSLATKNFEQLTTQVKPPWLKYGTEVFLDWFFVFQVGNLRSASYFKGLPFSLGKDLASASSPEKGNSKIPPFPLIRALFIKWKVPRFHSAWKNLPSDLGKSLLHFQFHYWACDLARTQRCSCLIYITSSAGKPLYRKAGSRAACWVLYQAKPQLDSAADSHHVIYLQDGEPCKTFGAPV